MCLSALFPRVVVEFERRAENKNTAVRARSGMKKRDILLKYPDKSKAESLIKRLYERGMWYYDPDFDKDDEDICFLSAGFGSTVSERNTGVKKNTNGFGFSMFFIKSNNGCSVPEFVPGDILLHQ